MHKCNHCELQHFSVTQSFLLFPSDILMLTYNGKLKLVNTPVLKHPFKTTATIPTVTQKVGVYMYMYTSIAASCHLCPV